MNNAQFFVTLQSIGEWLLGCQSFKEQFACTYGEGRRVDRCCEWVCFCNMRFLNVFL